MGGDHAPNAIIGGVAIASKKDSGLRFILHGDEAKIRPLLAQHNGLEKVCEIAHTDKKVSSDDKPSVAVRSGKGTSMWRAIESVKDGKAGAVVSAGNTGALMAISKMCLKTIAGIHRPAIISILPTEKDYCVMLDLGANTDCDAVNLVEFAVMGVSFAKAILGKERPTVGLLNIGSEEMKGKEEIRQAAQAIKETDMDIDFIGFVEGHDIGKGTADVIVTDGFTGNVALKTIEGTCKLFVRLVKNQIKGSILGIIGFLIALLPLKKVKDKMDPRYYNGAMLVGLNGISVKSHGGTDEVGFATAIKNAARLIRHDINDKIKREITGIDIEGTIKHIQESEK